MQYQGIQSNLDSAATYLSPFELELVKEINALRSRPDSFVRDLELRAAQFKGKDLQVGNKMLRTREGSGPVADAAAQLAAQQPVPPLRISVRFQVKGVGWRVICRLVCIVQLLYALVDAFSSEA